MKKIFPLLLLIAPLFTIAQSGSERPAEKALLDLVYAHCAQADIITIERTVQGYVEIDYLCEGRMVEMGIMNGVEEFREEEIDAAAAPMAMIMKKIEKKHPGGFFDEISLMTVNDTSFLKVEVIEGGIEYQLFFTTEGKVFKPARDIGSAKWTLEAIAAIDVPDPIAYDLISPDTIVELPPILREVSGIALLDDRTVLCVQDEIGVVFDLDLRDGTIKQIRRFTDIGDFEDLTIHDGTVKVLRSDGTIFTLHQDGKILEELVRLSTLNVEGLHSSPKDDRLYLASKEPPLGGASGGNEIYTVGGEGQATKVLVVDDDRINELFNKQFPSLGAGRITFAPSALAIHPITGDLYLLSATDPLLAIYAKNELKAVFPLPAEIYYKPEGISFFPNGDMLISTEGDKKGFALPAIIRSNYRR